MARLGTHAVALLLVSTETLSAQNRDAMQPMATRADLTAMAARLERGDGGERNQAAMVRARLREGDFRPGDQVVVIIESSVATSDTLPVRSGSKVTPTDMGELSLAGVLRSEVEGVMKAHIAKYVRDARVRVVPLISLTFLGAVGKSGFYFLPPDIPLREAVMRAGGPAPTANLAKSEIKRGGTRIYDGKNTQTALSEGMTLDQLSLRSGDEITIATATPRSWQSVAQVVGMVTSLLIAISYGVSR